ncbi:MAG: HAD-IC family P-type ATPase [bacterium]
MIFAVFHNLTAAETLKTLSVSAEGLSEREAAARLKKYGKNILPKEKKFSRLGIFFAQFRSPLIYILLAAAGASIFVGDTIDALIIAAAIFINVIVGFLQEDKANRALLELKKIIKRTAAVKRGGYEKEIEAELIALGDIVILNGGDIVPADGRLIAAVNLEIDESGLTGESLPIYKNISPLKKDTVLAERKNMVFMGTVVSAGRGIFVATATGKNTRFGEIALLLREVKEEKTPLEIRIEKFSYFLGAIISLMAAGIFIFGAVSGRGVAEMFLISAAMAVASIPEGLPAAVTIILAFGARALLKQKALLRRMVAAETLGSASIICTDKTGTLTQGEMRAIGFETLDGELAGLTKKLDSGQRKILEIGVKISVLCNNALLSGNGARGNLTERALLIFGKEAGFKKEKLEKEYPRLFEIPFSSERKYMATMHREGLKAVIFAKGAPEILLSKCSRAKTGEKTNELSAESKKEIIKKTEEAAASGLRVLALAYKYAEAAEESFKEQDLRDMVYAGFISFKDPLRPHSAETVALARAAGIRTIMVTGDHRLTAMAIGKEIGLRTGKENILEGADIDAMPDENLQWAVSDVDIFARVSPRHKVRIAAAWQKRGEVVAMTGDGVNDAPAIKEADIGIALGTGSDVTREAADIVLLDNNFKTIVSAIERGRVIFENIRKVITYLLSDSFAEVILIAGSIMLGLPLPLTAAQILWINILNDTFPSLALAFDRGEADVMKQHPRKKSSPLLNKRMKAIIFIIPIVTNLSLLGIYYFVLRRTDNLLYSRTVAFVGLGIDSLFIAYSCRSLRKNLWNFSFWENKILSASIASGILALVAVLYLPVLRKIFKVAALDIKAWLMLLGFGILNLVMIELVKWVFIRRTRLAQNNF